VSNEIESNKVGNPCELNDSLKIKGKIFLDWLNYTATRLRF